MCDISEHDENDNVNATVLQLYAIQTKYVIAMFASDRFIFSLVAYFIGDMNV